MDSQGYTTGERAQHPFNTILPIADDTDEGPVGQLSTVQLAITELRQHVVDRTATTEAMVRRLYQIKAVIHAAAGRINAEECEQRRYEADVTWANALSGYEVGRDLDENGLDGDAIHVADLHSPERTFLCGAEINYTQDNLAMMRGESPICPSCTVEFTRRVFTPGALDTDRRSESDLTSPPDDARRRTRGELTDLMARVRDKTRGVTGIDEEIRRLRGEDR